jgi:hypothetical protein
VVRDGDHRFLHYLVKTFRRLPSDPFFEEIPPLEKLWLFESWCYDEEQKTERMKSQAILTGGFYNPEMAQRMIKRENPDFASTDEDFDDASRFVRQQIEQEAQLGRKGRRKRRKAKLIR